MPNNNAYLIAKLAQTKAVKKRKAQLRRKFNKISNHVQIDLAHGSSKQRQGNQAEQRACAYLIDNGLKILKQNLTCKLGEIDIIALDDDTLVFIEVRQRQTNSFGGAAASVSKTKQKHIIRTANYFLPSLNYLIGKKCLCRFDVIAIDGLKINWIKSAFTV